MRSTKHESYDNYTELQKDQSPYYVPQIEGMGNVSDVTIATKLKVICCVTKDSVSKAYELQRRKVTEILAFVISDTDRIHDGEHPNQIPTAYALKGYSLSTEKLRQMNDVVRNKCKAEGTDLLCEATEELHEMQRRKTPDKYAISERYLE